MLKSSSSRKSGLCNDEDFSWSDIDLSFFIQDYENLQDEYKQVQENYKQARRKRAYAVTFTGVPDIFFITFQHGATNEERRPKVVSSAILYHRDVLFHPAFMNDGWKEMFLRHTRTQALPQLDKYADTGRVPIAEYLEVGGKVKCSICGKYEFDYENYKAKRCYIVEGEGESVIPYLKGYCLCYNCFKKFYDNSEN